jgi:hypothetical protein
MSMIDKQYEEMLQGNSGMNANGDDFSQVQNVSIGGHGQVDPFGNIGQFGHPIQTRVQDNWPFQQAQGGNVHQDLKKMFFVNKQGNVGQVCDVVEGYCAIRWVDGDVTIVHGNVITEQFEDAKADDIVKARKAFA